jgi:predicted dehydrogenase
MARYKAAVVGLGQVGLLFDDDPKRTGVWTHCRAYERMAARFDLVAACDPEPTRRAKVEARFPALHAYAQFDDMLRNETLDVVSLCTPPELHLSQIEALAGKVRAIVCEKPLGGNGADAARVVERCTAAGTLLAINYYKRFDAAVPTAAQMIRSGRLGTIRSATALYAGPLEAVGSHAIDLLCFLLGPIALNHAERTEDDRTLATFSFAGNGHAVLHQTGPREELIFELDIVGSKGRIRILDNCDRLEYKEFAASPRYSGYRELQDAVAPAIKAAERFVPLFEEVADCLDGRSATLTSDGASALRAQTLLEKILDVR